MEQSADMNDEKQPIIGAAPTVQVQLSQPEAMVAPVVQVMVLGCVASLQRGGVPLPVIYFALAKMLGLTLAATVNGPLADVLRLRSDLKKSFEDGVKQAPLLPTGGVSG